MIKDRGKLKWAPFMLPQHNQMINKCYQEMGCIDKPILDEQQLERLDGLVKAALSEQATVQLSYYENKRLFNLKGKLRLERNNLYLANKYLLMDNIVDITVI